MSEIAVSKLGRITFEIHMLNQQGIQVSIDIGKRLDTAKSEFRSHEDWLSWAESEFGYKKSQAYKLVAIGREFQSTGIDLSQYSVEKLYALTGMDDEFRTKSHELSSGETKTVDEMTVREIEQAKRAQREAEHQLAKVQQELAVTQEQSTSILDRDRRLREENERLKREKNPEPVVKIERLETVPPDYHLIQTENRELKLKNESLKTELQVMKFPLLENKFEVRKRKQDLNQDARSLTSKIEVFIKDIAPLAYLSRLVVDADDDILSEYEEALSILERWIFDVRQNVRQTSQHRSVEVIDLNNSEVYNA